MKQPCSQQEKTKEWSLMKILKVQKIKFWMGVERRSKVVSKEEMELVAYHEAGHAIAGLYSPNKDPMHKVTIIPRGNAVVLHGFYQKKIRIIIV